VQVVVVGVKIRGFDTVVWYDHLGWELSFKCNIKTSRAAGIRSSITRLLSACKTLRRN